MPEHPPILLIYQLTPGVVDEDRPVLHSGDGVPVDEPLVFRRQVAVKEYHIGAFQQFLQPDILTDGAAGIGGMEIAGEDLHAENMLYVSYHRRFYPSSERVNGATEISLIRGCI